MQNIRITSVELRAENNLLGTLLVCLLQEHIFQAEFSVKFKGLYPYFSVMNLFKSKGGAVPSKNYCTVWWRQGGKASNISLKRP